MMERGIQAEHTHARHALSLASGTSQGTKGLLRPLRLPPQAPLLPSTPPCDVERRQRINGILCFCSQRLGMMPG